MMHLLQYGEGIYGLPQYDAATGELIDIGSVFDPFLNPIPNRISDRDRRGNGHWRVFMVAKKSMG